MNKSALIVMTTYNGGKYLPQQLDSIISQTHENWTLIIRDDGSTDETRNILSDYEGKDKRIHVFLNDSDNHGAYLNFWTMIHKARNEFFDYDYYFFSDQDDVWVSDKLELMISESENEPKDIPFLLYSDMRVIDQDNETIYESLNDVMGIGQMSGYSLFFTHGYLWGCDVCVNNKLFNSMPLLPLDHPNLKIMSHDNYMGKYAMLTGKIRFLNKPLINHRRHGNNTTGGYSMKLSPVKVIKRIFKYGDLARTHARVYNQTLVALNLIGTVLPDEPLIPVIRNAIRTGGFTGTKIMKSLNVRRKQKQRTLGIYLVMFFKSYKKYLEVADV